MELMKRSRGRPKKLAVSVVSQSAKARMSPLEYMLTVMNDPTAQQSRRDRMAIYAAPYCHPKLVQSQPVNKKDQQAEAAEQAGMGTAWTVDLETETRAN